MKALGSERMPRSGNAALWAGALIQGVLGIEFVLTGLSKFADGQYQAQFRGFVTGNPGAHHGLIAPLLQALVLPHLWLAAEAARYSEVALGGILLLAAFETARRRLSGRLGRRQGYEPIIALAGAAAGLGAAALALSIFLIEGGVLPTINPAFAFASAIPVELMLVPLGLGMAVLELGRFKAVLTR
jgi:hypothetical protein